MKLLYSFDFPLDLEKCSYRLKNLCCLNFRYHPFLGYPVNLQSPEFHPALASDPPGHFHRHHCYRDLSDHPLEHPGHLLNHLWNHLLDHLWNHPCLRLYLDSRKDHLLNLNFQDLYHLFHSHLDPSSDFHLPDQDFDFLA